jgi:beta propeller repeat protein
MAKRRETHERGRPLQGTGRFLVSVRLAAELRAMLGLPGKRRGAMVRVATFGMCLVLTLLLGLAPAQAYRFEGSESQITAHPADQFDPSISGSLTVYTDRRHPDTDIFLFDLEARSEHQITSGGGDQMLNDICDQRVVYTDFGSGNADIYVYDVVTGVTTQLTDHPANQRRPSISGDRLVYEDDRHGDLEIYLYDLATGVETRLTDHPAMQRKPVISGDYVVWEDYRAGQADLYLADLSTGEVRVLVDDPADDFAPAIDGDVVAFTSARASLGDVYLLFVSTGELRAVTASSGFQSNASVSGDYVAYESYADGDADIWLYSISLGVSEQVTVDPAEQYLHDLSGNRVVYTDNRNGNLDIYLFEFVFDDPPPQGEGCDDPHARLLFGPQVYTRGHGAPRWVLDAFAGRELEGQTAYVCIHNGDPAGDQRVTSALVTFNDSLVAGPGDFGQEVDGLELPVELGDANLVGVQLRGEPGTTLTLRVVAPLAEEPVIIACATHDPSRGGWASGLMFFGLLGLPLGLLWALRRQG